MCLRIILPLIRRRQRRGYGDCVTSCTKASSNLTNSRKKDRLFADLIDFIVEERMNVQIYVRICVGLLKRRGSEKVVVPKCHCGIPSFPVHARAR